MLRLDPHWRPPPHPRPTVGDLPTRVGLAVLTVCLSLLVMACERPDNASHDAMTEPPPDDAQGTETAATRPSRPTERPTIPAAEVFAYEHAWPAIVVMTRAWPRQDSEVPLRARHRGSLVHALPDGRVRIDFGRHGVHEVPIEATDLLERIAEIDAGTRHKMGPNFILSLGTRLVDARSPTPAPLPSVELSAYAGFLCLFADVERGDFGDLAAHLHGLAEEAGVGLLLFPQSAAGVELNAFHEGLRALGWRAPYAYPRLAPDHTRALLGDPPEVATALLLTPEGRPRARLVLDDAESLTALRDALAVDD